MVLELVYWQYFRLLMIIVETGQHSIDIFKQEYECWEFCVDLKCH